MSCHTVHNYFFRVNDDRIVGDETNRLLKKKLTQHLTLSFCPSIVLYADAQALQLFGKTSFSNFVD